MKVVYEAEHLVDAHLIAGLLRQAGIDTFIKGEYLLGAIGELPVSNLVSVCVSEDTWPQARAIVEAQERLNRLPIVDEGFDAEPEAGSA